MNTYRYDALLMACVSQYAWANPLTKFELQCHAAILRSLHKQKVNF